MDYEMRSPDRNSNYGNLSYISNQLEAQSDRSREELAKFIAEKLDGVEMDTESKSEIDAGERLDKFDTGGRAPIDKISEQRRRRHGMVNSHMLTKQENLDKSRGAVNRFTSDPGPQKASGPARHNALDRSVSSVEFRSNTTPSSDIEFDISGQTENIRYPWLKDQAIQCDMGKTAEERASTISNSSTSFRQNPRAQRSLSHSAIPGGYSSMAMYMKHNRQYSNDNLPNVDGKVIMEPDVLEHSLEFYKEQAVESMDSMEGVPSNYRGGRRPCVISGLDLGDQVEEHQPFEDSNTKSYPGDLVLTSAQPLRHPSPPTVNGGTNDHYGSEGSLAEAGSNTSQTPPKDDGRRISVRDFFKTKKGKKTTADLEHVLITMKSTEFRDLSLASHRHSNWQTVLASESNPNASISDVERNRRDAVWEIFTNECIFLVDHLSVLRHCFMEPLKNCQVEGLLMEVEPNKLFGNLNELISLSYRFCREFFSALRTTSQSDFASTSSLCDCLDTMTLNSRDGSIYHSYLLNYRSALTYLDILRNTLEDYTFFERFCEQDSRCKKLRLSDLLVAPMQHWTRLPLILERVRKYTTSQSEIDRLIASTEKVRSSLKSLENKIEWLKTFERVKQIEKQLIWPAITEVDTKTYIPESLRPILRAQKTDNLLDDKVREITMEGPLMLTEKDNRTVDTYIFLFTDFLLLTKLKKKLKGRASTINKNEGFYHVLKQPIPVNSLSVHDIGATEASTSGMKNMFVVIQRNSFQQVVGVFTLQAHTALGKEKWLKHIRDNKERTVEINNNDLESQKTFRDSQETNYNSSMAHKFDKNFLKNSQVLEITHSATLPRNMERSQNHNLLHPNSPSLDESMPAATRQRLMFDKSRTLSTGCLSSDHSLLLLNGNL